MYYSTVAPKSKGGRPPPEVGLTALSHNFHDFDQTVRVECENCDAQARTNERSITIVLSHCLCDRLVDHVLNLVLFELSHCV